MSCIRRSLRILRKIVLIGMLVYKKEHEIGIWGNYYETY